MAPDNSQTADPPQETLEIDLRQPGTAALLAWLWPGAGHLYQRRYAKAILFMVCILGTYFYGLFLGSGRVVYASWKEEDRRWQYVCQLGVGSPAFGAMVQSYLVGDGRKPLLIISRRDSITMKILEENEQPRGEVLYEGLMAPPPGRIDLNSRDALALWHEELHAYFELGTLFTVVAGLLNVLAVYDAYAGPVLPEPEPEDESSGKDDKKK